MRRFAFLLAMILVLSMPLEVFAASKSTAIYPVLTFSGATATCVTTVAGNNSTSYLEVTMKLMYLTTIVASWTGSGYGYVSMTKTAAVTKGRTYKLVVEVKENGVAQNPVYVTGNS